jgi:hypothetical protein
MWQAVAVTLLGSIIATACRLTVFYVRTGKIGSWLSEACRNGTDIAVKMDKFDAVEVELIHNSAQKPVRSTARAVAGERPRSSKGTRRSAAAQARDQVGDRKRANTPASDNLDVTCLTGTNQSIALGELFAKVAKLQNMDRPLPGEKSQDSSDRVPEAVIVFIACRHALGSSGDSDGSE